METVIRKIQMLINVILNDYSIYVINPDGSVMELQPGFALLEAKLYKAEMHTEGN